MQEQNFKNHYQFVIGFHLVTSLFILASLITSIVLIVSSGISVMTIFGLLVSVSLGLLFAFLRLFATGNQDRIIRAEENFRSFRLTGKMLDSRLTRSQIIALRFADDTEYAALSDKAISENLSSTDIKKAVQQWRADYHRI
jgi:hypothetical protein